MQSVPAWRVKPGHRFEYRRRQLRMATHDEALRHPAKELASRRTAKGRPTLLCYMLEGKKEIPASVLGDETVFIQKRKKNSER